MRRQAEDLARPRVHRVQARRSKPPSRRLRQDRAAPLGDVVRGADDGHRARREDGVEIVGARDGRPGPSGCRAGALRAQRPPARRRRPGRLPAHEQRVHVDLADRRVVGDDLGDRADDLARAAAGRRAGSPRSTGPSSLARLRSASTMLAADRRVHRRQGERHVGHGLGEDAAEAEARGPGRTARRGACRRGARARAAPTPRRARRVTRPAPRSTMRWKALRAAAASRTSSSTSPLSLLCWTSGPSPLRTHRPPSDPTALAASCAPWTTVPSGVGMP